MNILILAAIFIVLFIAIALIIHYTTNASLSVSFSWGSMVLIIGAVVIAFTLSETDTEDYTKTIPYLLSQK